MTSASTTRSPVSQTTPAPTVTRLQAELAALCVELAAVCVERDQLRSALIEVLANQVQLRAQLAQTHTLDGERQNLHQELVDLKRKPFVARRRPTSDPTAPAKLQGRAVGHPGQSRTRPTWIDRTQPIPAGDSCPDCGTPFTGTGTTRERVYDEMRTKLWRFATERWRDWKCQQLAERIRKYLADLVIWLIDPAVDPTNNQAEQALRGAVVTRKTSFGSRSKRGTHAFARLLSIIMTWECQGKDLFTTAHATLVGVCSQS